MSPRTRHAAAATEPAVVRCAVYTRVSTDEGLAQEFNSLHNQREACETYIAAQRHEGWELLHGPRGRRMRPTEPKITPGFRNVTLSDAHPTHPPR